MDDGIIASETEEEHLKDLRIIFEFCKKYGLILKTAKCIFDVEDVPFLRYLINKDRIQLLPEKVAAICEYKLTAKQLHQFLGMINFLGHVYLILLNFKHFLKSFDKEY